MVAADGTLVRGSGAVSSAYVGTGDYTVVFNRDVSGCAFLATIAQPGNAGVPPSGEVILAGLSGNLNGVFVDTRTSAGVDNADQHPFHLLVSC